jgi:hypothetical protein
MERPAGPGRRHGNAPPVIARAMAHDRRSFIQRESGRLSNVCARLRRMRISVSTRFASLGSNRQVHAAATFFSLSEHFAPACSSRSFCVHLRARLVSAVQLREVDMSEKITSKSMSRRSAFSLLGLSALCLAMLPTVLTPTDAEAEEATTKTGTERRQERRTHRSERRQERRTHRTERRQERRTGRTERREERRTGGEQK